MNITNIQELPKDLKRKIALELSPRDFIHFCLTGTTTNKEVCDSDEFWRLKLQRDYPKIFDYHAKYNLTLKNPKNTYVRTFTNFSREIEDFSKSEGIPEEELYDLYYAHVNKGIREGVISRELVNKYKGHLRERDFLEFHAGVFQLLNKLKRIAGYHL